MTTQTQTTVKLEQLPYGQEAALVSALIALPGKLIAGLGKAFATLGAAIEMRNRILELNDLNDAALSQFGIQRQTITQFVAIEAGLLRENAKTPVAGNSNLRTIRPAA